MEFMVILFLTALAMGNAQDCSEERAEGCVDTLLSALIGDSAEEEVCKELNTAISCLRQATAECVAQEDMDEVEEGLGELEKLLRDNCESEENEIGKCFEANEDYVYECIYEGTSQALTVLAERDEVDENELQCMIYSSMSECFTDRVKEKCGEKAGDLAREELLDAPAEIKQACEAAESTIVQALQLTEKKRRK